MEKVDTICRLDDEAKNKQNDTMSHRPKGEIRRTTTNHMDYKEIWFIINPNPSNEGASRRSALYLYYPIKATFLINKSNQ